MPPHSEQSASHVILIDDSKSLSNIKEACDDEVDVESETLLPEKAAAKSEEAGKQNGVDSTEGPGFGQLMFCFTGIVLSFVLHNLILEKVMKEKICPEMSMVFISSVIYCSVAAAGKKIRKEPSTETPTSKILFLAVVTFVSSWSSIFCLRYVSFPARVLGKSCKSIPVMLMGTVLGKRYSVQKYLAVILISIGVSMFMFGKPSNHADDEHKQTWMGLLLLGISLAADGLTGALEDKYMSHYYIGPFDLMYLLHKWRILISFGFMVILGEVALFAQIFVKSWASIAAMGFSGALGQVFIFYTISVFGALTTSIIGTCRKVVTVCASIVIFGHVMYPLQVGGLFVTLVGIVGNMIKGKKRDQKKAHESKNAVHVLPQHAIQAVVEETDEEALELPGLDESGERKTVVLNGTKVKAGQPESSRKYHASSAITTPVHGTSKINYMKPLDQRFAHIDSAPSEYILKSAAPYS